MPDEARSPHPNAPSSAATSLLYEKLDGHAIYFGPNQWEQPPKDEAAQARRFDLMQSALLSHLLRVLYSQLDADQYQLLPNEHGIQVNADTHLVADLAVYRRSELTAPEARSRFIEVSPLAVVLIDSPVLAPAEPPVLDYAMLKVQRLLDFGVQQVLWLHTYSRRMLVARPKTVWLNLTWHNEVDILNLASFRLYEVFPQNFRPEDFNGFQ
jgi:hypothetical protein